MFAKQGYAVDLIHCVPNPTLHNQLYPSGATLSNFLLEGVVHTNQFLPERPKQCHTFRTLVVNIWFKNMSTTLSQLSR